MKKNYHRTTSRRNFLKTGARFGIFSGLIFLGINLSTTKKNNNNKNECRLTLPCRKCKQRAGCNNQKFLNSSELDKKFK